MSIAKYKQDKYRISTVMKVETNIIASITVNPMGQVVIPVSCIMYKMYVETFITLIVFIGNVIGG